MTDAAATITVLETQRDALDLAIAALRAQLNSTAPQLAGPESSPIERSRRYVAGAELLHDIMDEAPRDWSVPELLEICSDRGYGDLYGVTQGNFACILSRGATDYRNGHPRARYVRTARGRYMAARHVPDSRIAS